DAPSVPYKLREETSYPLEEVMAASVESNLGGFKAILFILTFIVLGLICSTGFSYEWTINGVKVTAKAIDFNGSQVILEDNNGSKKAVPVNELTAEDLQYLTNLLQIRNAEIQLQLERQQIRQQQAQLVSQFVDVWTVRMVAPNGETGWRNYFAANSLHAKQLAWNEFPNARITSVQRVRRSSTFLGGASVGLTPAANQTSIFNQIRFRN
ncbi:MAG: hypothetical protein AAGA30_17125, partial [Planctomycetota bacterium]